VLHMQAGAVETPLDGAAFACFQFQVGEPFQGSRWAEALFSSVGECDDSSSFSGSLSRNAPYSSSESWSVASSLSRGSLSPDGRLHRTRCTLLAEDVGDVVRAEGTRGGSFVDRQGDGLRSVIADQFVGFGNLARQGPVRLSQVRKYSGRRAGRPSVAGCG
jgi:hypothetical protein